MTRIDLPRRRLDQEKTILSDVTIVTAAASVPTAHGSLYLQQLAKHWSHKFEVVFDAAHATIDFASGARATLDAAPDTLAARIEAPDAETLARMKTVLAEHLDRFAFREAPLPFDWR